MGEDPPPPVKWPKLTHNPFCGKTPQKDKKTWTYPGDRSFFENFRFYLHKKSPFCPIDLKMMANDRPCLKIYGALENIFFRFFMKNPDF